MADQEIIKNKLNEEDLSIFQLLYLVKKLGLKKQLDINGGFHSRKPIDLLSKNISVEYIDDILDNAKAAEIDLNNLNLELTKLKKKELRDILKKGTSIHIASSNLIYGIFLFVPFETIEKELNFNATFIDDKRIISKKDSQESTSESKQRGSVTEESPDTDLSLEAVGSETINEVDETNLKSKLLEYDEDYLLDILFDHKEYFDSIKDLNRKEFNKQRKDLKEKITKEKLIQTILDNISPKILKDYYFSKVVYEFFPKTDTFKNPREYQIETISQIYNAIKNGYKYIFLEAVAGFGKSLIAATLTRIYSKDKSYILTPTNQLLTPYEEEFKDFGLYKIQARSNFRCKLTRDNCSPSACRDAECRYYNNSCEYFSQLREGLKSSAIVSTYKYFFLETFYQSNDLEHRKLLICDEGHNIDDMIAQGISLNIHFSRLRDDDDNYILDIDSELKDLEQTEDYYLFLLILRQNYENYLKYGTDNILKKKISRDLKYLNKFLSYFDRNDNNIAFERQKTRLVFSPIKIKKFVPDLIGKYADVCIFMSSSIFDHENFAFDLGIDESEVFKIKVPNIFNSSDNPIKIYNDLKMDWNSLKEENKEKAIPIIKDILKKHKNDKGIIHTFNNKCADFLNDNLNEERCMPAYGKDREDVLNDFKNDEVGNKVLISPSMDVGVDLPGDLCRFQIIFKLPYHPYKEARINKRKACYEDGDDWYDNKMLTRLIQTYGRGIRYKGDYCKTYILDNRLFGVIDEDYERKRIIPKYFLDAIIDDI